MLLVAAACSDDAGSGGPDANNPSVDATIAADTALASDASMTPDATSCQPNHILYFNRSGGTYTMGAAENSANNVSTLLQQTEAIAPYVVDDTLWNAVLSCVRGHLAPYDVDVVDTDPGTAEHVEVVFVGNPDEVQPLPGTVGVSPFSCEHITRAIVLFNANAFGTDTDLICEQALTTLGPAYGLEHAFHCPDLMSQLTGCGAKSFTDTDAQCGDFAPATCTCGGATQNSHQTLLSVLGPHCN